MGKWEVTKLRTKRFVRCPDVLCGVRVDLAADDTTESDIDDTVDIHRRTGGCFANKKAKP